MARITDKTVKSKYPPKQTNVTWIDTSQKPAVTKSYIDGQWVVVGGGVTDYNDIKNKPSINGVELDGNKTSQELGVYSKPSGGIPQSDLSSDVQSQLNKHFKGWYASSNALPSNSVVGDYAYVKGAESTDPAAIYECTTNGTWSDSGRTADTSNVQTFASGEEVNETYIDDTHLVNPKGGALPKAEDVMQLKVKLEGVTARETKVQIITTGDNQNVFQDKFLKSDGKIATPSDTNATKVSLLVADCSGFDKVRFLGAQTTSSSISMSYGFASVEPDPTDTTSVQVQTNDLKTFDTNQSSISAKEYVINVPNDKPYFVCTIAQKFSNTNVMSLNDFYLYKKVGAAALNHGNIINDLITGGADDVLSAEQGKIFGQKIGSQGGMETYSDSSKFSGMYWGGDKVYAASSSYDSYIFEVIEGIKYSWNDGFTFQKFNSLPTIGSSAGRIGTLSVSANTPWESDGHYWLMINVNPSNPVSVIFTTYASGIIKEIGDINSNVGTLANLDTTNKTNLVNAINEVKEKNDESILSVEDEIGNEGEIKTYSTLDDCSDMFWGGDKVYAANASYNSYVFEVKKGVSYSWNNGTTFQKFNSAPTIGSKAGRIGTLIVVANTPWEADADYWLMLNVTPSNLLSIKFTTYARGIIKEINEIKSKVGLPGIKIVCFGDSLTEFGGTDGKRYSDWLAELSGADIVNCGIGGTQLRQRTISVLTPTTTIEAYAALDIINLVKAACDRDFTKQENAAEYLKNNASDDNTATIERLEGLDFSTVDLVTVFAGTNDFALGGNLGTSGSTDINSTLGAINEIIRLLLQTYPNLHIIWFTPVVRWADDIANRNASNWVDVWQGYTSEGKTLIDYKNAIINEVQNNFVPVVDMIKTMCWTKYNFSQYFVDTDGTHPRKGFKAIATKFLSEIISSGSVLVN